eukprot:GHVQ01002580.1.p1 GENE.GHVQ01002580.1~~GHVQ01002580.1.p1  ORF type:complete len:663 (-),score=85.32 GHVQ01002580.1:1280-3268(-)
MTPSRRPPQMYDSYDNHQVHACQPHSDACQDSSGAEISSVSQQCQPASIPPSSTQSGGRCSQQQQVQLPREVLKWLQALDLSYAVRNVRRDFANGYLVAEVCSRYFPQEVQMHSYDRGCNMTTKRSNWELLYKLMVTKKLPFHLDHFEPVMHCAPGAAATFVTKLYCILTNRKLPEPKILLPSSPLPSYAQPTGAAIMRDREITRIQDHVTMISKAKDALSKHDEERSRARAQQVQESAKRASSVRGRLRTDQAQAVLPEHQQIPLDVQQVKVNPLVSASALKAKQNLQAASGRSTSSDHAPRDCLGTEEVERLICSAVETCSQDGFALNECSQALHSQATALAEMVSRNSSDFWKLWTALHPFLCNGECLGSAVRLLVTVGHLIRRSSPVVGHQLTVDVLIVEISPLLLRNHNCKSRLAGLLDVLFSYVPSQRSQWVQLLKCLKMRLNDTACFIGGLAHFLKVLVADMERTPAKDSQREISEDEDVDLDLIELCLYYTLVGAVNTQPSVRLCCVTILRQLSTISLSNTTCFESLLGLTETYAQLAKDDSGEVQVAVGRLICELLPRSSHDELKQQELLAAIAWPLASSASSSHVKENILHAMSKLLKCDSVSAPLRDLFTSSVISLSSGSMERLVCVAGSSKVCYKSGDSTNDTHNSYVQT